MHAILVSAAAALAASAFASSKNCTQGPNTACDSQWTCCQTEYSNSNTGCCLLPDAVCCGSAPPPPVRAAGAQLEGEPLPSWGVGYCCPSGHKCVNITGGGIGCEASDWAAAASAASASAGSTTDSPGRASSSQDSPTPANFVCKPGASKPASRTQPNIAVLGDSVSIGYEPPTAAMLASKYFIQHTPWDTRGGGSGTSQYGLECLPALMRTSMSEHVNWDLVVFNFGLHDLDPSNSSQATYEQQLKDIAQQLRQYSARQLYALTTPYMPDKTKGIDIVQELNARAERVMKELGIPVVDLYSAVTDVCGKVYTDCSICRKSPCSYHYTPEGYQVIAKTLAPAIEAQMAG